MDDKLVESHALDAILPCPRWPSCGQYPAGDDQITWPTAMPAATDLACVVADGYSVNRRIAPKQWVQGLIRQTWHVDSSAFAKAINNLDEETFQALYGWWDSLEPV